jgi:hypothetical protein
MRPTLLVGLRIMSSLILIYAMFSGFGCVGKSPLSQQQEKDLEARLSKAGLPLKYDGPMTGTSGYLRGSKGIILFDKNNIIQDQQSTEEVKNVVGNFLNEYEIKELTFVAVMGSDGRTRTIDLELPKAVVPPSQGTLSQHYSYQSLSFDYPSYLSIPDKEKFDVEKVREMLRPSGVDMLTILMSTDMDLAIQVARTKRSILFDSLYQEKMVLAGEINRGGVNVMGEQYTKFVVEKSHLSGGTQALYEYGEKTNGEVAVTFEFLNEGFDYALMFIYKNRELSAMRANDREQILKSIKITTK